MGSVAKLRGSKDRKSRGPYVGFPGKHATLVNQDEAELRALLASDSDTFAYFSPTAKDGAEREVDGSESIWWDLMSGKDARGEEQASGAILLYAVYEITACQANFFYTGCAVGDIFICSTVKTCDANNKVKRVTGNHLTQPVSTKRPVNGAFDGTDDFLKMAAATLDTAFLYIIFKQTTWTRTDFIFAGNAALKASLFQFDVTPQVSPIAGGSTYVINFFKTGAHNTLRLHYNGASSTGQLNRFVAPSTGYISGNFGTRTFDGFTLGSNYDGSASSNIEVLALIIRKSAVNEDAIFRKIRKIQLGKSNPKPMIAFSTDDGQIENYTVAKPMFESRGMKLSMAIITDSIGDTGYMSEAQIIEMQSNGHEIMSHTKSHAHLTAISIEAATEEMSGSKTALEAIGANVKALAYPFGETNAAVTAAALTLYESAFVVGTLPSYLPISLGGITRINVDAASLATLKSHVDYIIDDAGFSNCFFYGHPLSWNATQQQIIADLLDYIASNGLTVDRATDVVNKIKTYQPAAYYNS